MRSIKNSFIQNIIFLFLIITTNDCLSSDVAKAKHLFNDPNKLRSYIFYEYRQENFEVPLLRGLPKKPIAWKEKVTNENSQKISLKAPKKDGVKDPALLRRFLLLTSLYNFSIKGIQEHAVVLIDRIINSPLQYKNISIEDMPTYIDVNIDRIINSPLQYKNISIEDMPTYIDVNNAENNVKNQFALLFANTDFDCNSMIHQIDQNKTNRNSPFKRHYTNFYKLLMILSENNKIDSLPIVEQWLDQGADPNAISYLEYKHNSENIKFSYSIPFATALNFLLEGKIQCTDPKKMITVFLEKKANPNTLCLTSMEDQLSKKTPFQVFIHALNKEKIVLDKNNTDELIHLFIQSGANRDDLNQLQKGIHK